MLNKNPIGDEPWRSNAPGLAWKGRPQCAHFFFTSKEDLSQGGSGHYCREPEHLESTARMFGAVQHQGLSIGLKNLRISHCGLTHNSQAVNFVVIFDSGLGIVLRTQSFIKISDFLYPSGSDDVWCHSNFQTTFLAQRLSHVQAFAVLTS